MERVFRRGPLGVEGSTVFGAGLLAEQEPAFGDVADALEFALHLGVLGFHQFRVRIFRHINGRGKQNYGAGERHGKQKMVPGVGESLAAIDADVKHHHRASRLLREHDGPRLCHVARSARPIDGKGAIQPFFEPPRHHRQSAQPAARRAALGSAKTKPLDHLARPLAVKRGRVHHHHAMMTVPPDDREDDAVPKRPDAALAGGVHLFVMMPAQHFVAQRWPEQTNQAVHRGGNERNLDAPRPRQGRQARVVMRADRFRGRSFHALDGGVRWHLGLRSAGG